MPHRQALHLPSTLTQRAVYDKMKIEFEKTVSVQQFYKLWNMHFKDVTIPAVSK